MRAKIIKALKKNKTFFNKEEHIDFYGYDTETKKGYVLIFISQNRCEGFVEMFSTKLYKTNNGFETIEEIGDYQFTYMVGVKNTQFKEALEENEMGEFVFMERNWLVEEKGN